MPFPVVEWKLNPDGTLSPADPVKKTLPQGWMLWPASSFLLDGDSVYAFTADRAAYKRKLKK